MSIAVTDLTTLDPTQVGSVLATLTQMLQEANPTLDLKRGVLHDLLAYYSAVLTVKEQTEVANYLSANSLSAIIANPTLADPGVVDAVFSNYLVARGAGENAVGEAAIVLSASNSVTIGSGAVFSANGNTYASNSSFTAKAEASQINSATDRLLTQLSDGTWVFTIDVTASAPGAGGIIPMNTLLVPAAPPANYVTSYAASDFTGGIDAETNTAMLGRLQQGIAARVPSNRVNMQAMLRAQSAFSGVAATSIIGHGDAELIRADHTIFPVRMGGYIDWYVRPCQLPVNLTLTKTAVLTGYNNQGAGVWQVAILNGDAPGFFEVAAITPPAVPASFGSLQVVSDTRGVDTGAFGFAPDIQTPEEGAFSRYQTSVIQFADPATPPATAVGAAASYLVTLVYVPQIDAIQDFMNGRDVRSIGADLLVKAPVPCFVQLAVTISKMNTQADPDTADMASALAQAVNTTGFVGRLYASTLQDVIGGYLQQNMSAGAVNMTGRVRFPDGAIKYLYSDDILIVPDCPDQMVSANTVQFFTTAADISIQVTPDIPVPA